MGIDVHQIAKTHNRSVSSIVARLVKLWKIGSKEAREAAPERPHKPAMVTTPVR